MIDVCLMPSTCIMFIIMGCNKNNKEYNGRIYDTFDPSIMLYSVFRSAISKKSNFKNHTFIKLLFHFCYFFFFFNWS
jgi:hypothetical protein